ncbi:glutamate-5-semialdehyde dehydrogenase (plasmid) [Streptomyces sp. BHT-5-2]|uniref:glutamate-5-semialdehyde dehydrogenase n=1 Tax=Streptomyces sp. BHT-5-2 TaxID=2866715 RepID=UPI001C8E14F7|nr:glutamate-5-semialdehyde dehydrogenase [Streptomyces sp. BHT-5-2]QZL04208.1 glutamate-5-semialdehyde dehydrogenase [Streptomyces sp. BHT-5-2]QZL08174.1 glutamate-5-semialdehyde dehydrogenase [Streptomyces sp. BHT-5-2]
MDIDQILDRTSAARMAAPPIGDGAYRAFVQAIRARIDEHWPFILEGNARDLAAAREQGLSEALLERLRLTDAQRISLERACVSIERNLPDQATVQDSSLVTATARSHRVRRPLGVILMIFESRAEIAIRSAAMCGATGNAVLLRGGKEMTETARSISGLLSAALADAGLPEGLVTLLDSSDRRQLKELLRRDDAIDVIIPRGSPSLIEHCRTASRIPLIASGGGVNHIYVHHSADLQAAARLTLDSKLFDPAACTALDMVLVDDSAVDAYLAALDQAVEHDPESKRCILRLPQELVCRVPAALSAQIDPTRLGPHDNGREYMSPTLAIRPVSGLSEAIEHINRFGSGHTEGVIAASQEARAAFGQRIDAATIVVNGSLRLNDAAAMGIGTALAISTGRLHVRGPVTLESLYTYSWTVEGTVDTHT